MTIHYFCTLFDSGYLLKGLAMIRSLAKFCPEMKVYVLCMDEQTKHILDSLDFPYVICITLTEIETNELLQAKVGRGEAEYCWTLSPCLPWYVLEKYQEVDFITYLDADLLFYSSIAPIFEEISNSSIAIIEHRFSPRLKDREVNGRFCVEWVSFRRDKEGLACLSRWRAQCIEWCFYRLEEGKMGDQKYLDEWPEKYSSVHIIQHLGAGVAPWNYSQYDFRSNDKGSITVNGAPLIFYHFHQFQLLENGNFDRLSTFYTSECVEPATVYERYEEKLSQCLDIVRALVPDFRAGLRPLSSVRSRRFVQRFVPMGIKEFARRFWRY